MSREPLFSPRSNPCINYRTGCEGVVTKRGSVLCDKCAEERKMASKKKELEFDELLIKCKKLEEELDNTKKKCDDLIDHNTMVMTQPERNDRLDYYEKELQNLTAQNCRLKLENESLIGEKSRYELLFSQAKIDVEQIQLEKERIENELNSTIKNLQEKIDILEGNNDEEEKF